MDPGLNTDSDLLKNSQQDPELISPDPQHCLPVPHGGYHNNSDENQNNVKNKFYYMELMNFRVITVSQGEGSTSSRQSNIENIHMTWCTLEIIYKKTVPSPV